MDHMWWEQYVHKMLSDLRSNVCNIVYYTNPNKLYCVDMFKTREISNGLGNERFKKDYTN